jgi:hypothetical protein
MSNLISLSIYQTETNINSINIFLTINKPNKTDETTFFSIKVNTQQILSNKNLNFLDKKIIISQNELKLYDKLKINY